MRFELLNVFTTEESSSGNQLAVVFVDKNLTASEMQTVAKNFNFSETVFVRDHYQLRIYTPQSELPFAGHPTIGAAYAIGLQTKRKQMSLEVPLGVIEVEARSGGASLLFPGRPVISDYSGNIATVLGHCQVEENQVHMELIRLVNVGPEFLVIPVKSHQALKRAVSPLGLKEPLKCYFIFQQNPDTFFVRMFAPSLSVNEDPATGSAACALGGYLRDVMDIAAGAISIFQGSEMKRPGLISLEWGRNFIKLSGAVTKWGEGNL